MSQALVIANNRCRKLTMKIKKVRDDDDASDFPIQLEMLDNVKTRLERNYYSRHELSAEDFRDFKTTGNKEQ